LIKLAWMVATTADEDNDSGGGGGGEDEMAALKMEEDGGGATASGTLDASAAMLDGDLMQPVQHLLVKSLSSESQRKVKDLVSSIDGLSKFERLLLYLELPSTQVVGDPLRQ